jgi:uncharacterized protein
MKRFFLAPSASIILFSATTAIADVATCDRLASSPHDHMATVPGVNYQSLREHAQHAVDACQAATIAAPKNLRARYQFGRSLIALGRDTAAAKSLRIAADGGYPAAMNALGVLLNHGRGVTLNNAQALKYFKAAAAKDNIPAKANLGAMYNNIAGEAASGTVDRKTSMRWLKAAAEAGDPLAMARLGWNHGMGDGGAQKDKQLAFQWIERALAVEEESAYYIAIEISASGFMDMRRAAKYKQLARGRMNRLAIWNVQNYRLTAKLIRQFKDIGFRFERPEVEPTHIKEFIFDQDEYLAQIMDSMKSSSRGAARRAAIEFIAWVDEKRKQKVAKIAEIQGTPDQPAQRKAGKTECDKLATSPYDNLALPPFVSFKALRTEAQSAVKHCRKAVEQAPNDGRASYQLGRALLAKGDLSEATKWMRNAAEASYPAAMNAYGVLLNHGRGGGVSYKESFTWLQRAAKKNNAAAAINLATVYFMGLGTNLDAEAGTHWAKIGAAAGDPIAMFTLGAGYLGEGLWYRNVMVRRDLVKGIKLLVKAHEAGEREATYVLHQAISSYADGRFNRKEFKGLLQPAGTYAKLLDASGDRRRILRKLLRKRKSIAAVMDAIKTISASPHRVDLTDEEPVYVVDVFMDNEYVLGQYIKGAANKHIGVHPQLTQAYHALVNSERSFERTSNQQR